MSPSVPLVSRLRDRVDQELNARKGRASEVIEGLAGTVRRIGEPLHVEPLETLGAYADHAAGRLERLASGLRDRDVSELADDVRRLARERPGVYTAVGFAAGLAAARFLKSTAPGPSRQGRGIAANRARAVAAAAGGQPRVPGAVSPRQAAGTTEDRGRGRGERTK